jgi:hypothetical protein
MNQVSADYFKAMGIPLRAGRVFDERDVKGATKVIVIDESLARSGFNGESPIGKHLKFWKESWEIVGVVGGARYWGSMAIRCHICTSPITRLTGAPCQL